MTKPLSQLEERRFELHDKITRLGDFRAGSITGTGGRCGNPRCHCRQENDPGHGPYFRLTRKVEGKTVTETFASDAALRKAQREVEEYHRFRQLSQELLEVNEQICHLRPISEGEPGERKKKRPRRSKNRWHGN
jgi:hypothetical protein